MFSSALHRMTAVLDRYERTGDPDDLLGVDLSDEESGLAVAFGGQGSGRTTAQALAKLHWHRYLLLPGLAGLRERRTAVDLYRRLFRDDPDAVPESLRDECRDAGVAESDELSAVLLSWRQADRIAELWQRHHVGDGNALGMLVTLYREWLPDTVRQRRWPGVLLQASLLTDLADVLFALAAKARGTNRYNETLKTASKALAATTARDPHQLSRLTHRGRLFELYFDKGAGPKALELAVRDYRQAAQLGWQRRPTDLHCASRLGSALLRLHGTPTNASVEILLEAVAALRDAYICTDPDDPELPARLQRLDEAATLLVGTVGPDPVRTILAPVREPRTLDRLFRRNEKLAYRVRFSTSPRVRAERLNAALLLFAAVPGFHPARPLALLALSKAKLDQWQQDGDLHGAIQAVIWAQSALHVSEPEHPLRREMLNLLADAGGNVGLHRRSEEMLDVAVDAARTALELADNHPDDRLRQLGVLAEAYAQRGRLTGDPDALAEAVRHQREAVERTPAGHPAYPPRLMHLASLLLHHDVLVPDDALLAEAVQANRHALAALRRRDARRIGFTYNLAASLSRYAVRHGNLDELLAAERIFQDAFALLPSGHPDQPRIRSAIAEVRYERYQLGGDVDVLSGAVAMARQALDETSPDQHWWPIRAALLGRAAAKLAGVGGPGAESARAVARATYVALAASPVADTHTRIDAERQQAVLADGATDPAARLAALERAVQWMPAIVSRSASGPRRLDAIARVGGLASEAAAAAVAAQDLDAAVELLERGRGLLFNEALGIRAGWEELRLVDPPLATELDRVDRELSEADADMHVAALVVEIKLISESGDTEAKKTLEFDPRTGRPRQTRELATERNRLVEQIRALPGFADLLRPPSLPVLRERLRGLPIVVVNVHGDGGDALLIPAEPGRPVELLRLPDLREAAVQQQVTRLYSAVLDATDPAVSFDRRVCAQEDLLGVLAWLWDVATGPVLDRIAPPDEPVPHIWWCPVGTLARLPLHAAGHHREPGSRCTVLDRAVSSYTPTLTALAHAVAERPGRSTAATAAIVGVPDNGLLSALSEVGVEVEQVARLIPGSAVLSGTEVTPDAVEHMLRMHPIAHFACHGEADAGANAALVGGLHLGDATLSPQMVRSYRLDRPELAFLSACSTAETHPTFTDEPLHLASAFQLAGFRGVIGTMWRTTDSARITESFYSALTSGGTEPPNTGTAAQALTDTVRAIRDEFRATPTRWAGYVHVGLNKPLPPASQST
ncbi:CHAT domain-containing protein [Plantactinospora sp. S1510]|uniref:CHAT domain-containing protein n=1 Tax=Plantactinospora alkalitolerans TaxID=2789879 RepID=A0ABS0GNA2_9ACTN|nr:CHAT domain-containing protein [Plantactinospora alkalitolerans]MBF9127665.1 CHAT domain-containing protein [Plantactinospora alkalitolerans]